MGEPVKLDRLWTVVETAEYLGVPLRTLHQWRYHGTGPNAYKVGRWLRYDPAEVRRWLREDCTQERKSA